MTVGELIEKLETFDPNLQAIIPTCQNPYNSWDEDELPFSEVTNFELGHFNSEPDGYSKNQYECNQWINFEGMPKSKINAVLIS